MALDNKTPAIQPVRPKGLHTLPPRSSTIHLPRGIHSHSSEERFEQHRVIADEPRMAFAKNHLRRGPGGDQRMEPADRATRNGDEAKGENLSSEDRARAVDEARERRHQNLRPNKQDAGSK